MHLIMRSLLVVTCALLCVPVTFGQSDRGTITGTVSDSTNARLTQTTGANGQTVSGFGRINAATTFSNFLPRQGTIVARLTF